MGLPLKLGEIDLVTKASIFSLLSSQMSRYICLYLFHRIPILLEEDENTIRNAFNSIFNTNQDDMVIAKEEIFGPVQTILKFK